MPLRLGWTPGTARPTPKIVAAAMSLEKNSLKNAGTVTFACWESLFSQIPVTTAGAFTPFTPKQASATSQLRRREPPANASGFFNRRCIPRRAAWTLQNRGRLGP